VLFFKEAQSSKEKRKRAFCFLFFQLVSFTGFVSVKSFVVATGGSCPSSPPV